MKRGLILLVSLIMFGYFFAPHSVLAQEQPVLRIVVNAPPLAFPGQTITIFIETSINGTPTGGVFLSPHVIHDENGTIVINVLSAPTSFADGHLLTSFTVPDSGTGTYWIHVPGTVQGINATGSAAFVVLQKTLSSPPSSGGSSSLSNPTNILLILILAMVSIQAIVLLRRK
jgi:hypothetical protein